MGVKRIILDVDAGLDDAWAIFFFVYASKLNKIKIEAITCSRGNTTVENVCKNVIRLLEMMGRTDIPVYKGSHESIIKPEKPITPTHFGKDGFGDLEYESDPNMGLLKKTPAATAIKEIVCQNPNEITLVCLGPLANVALAIKLYDDFIDKVKEVYIMGGNYKAIGNSTSVAEFNFYMDPEAAQIVLDSIQCPLTILVYEAGIYTDIDIDWRWDVLGKIDSPIMRLMNEAEKKLYENKEIRGDTWYPFDCFLAVAIVYPTETIARHSKHHITVELAGNITRGQMVLDHLKKKEVNACIIERINQEFVKKTMISTMEIFQHIY